MAAIDSYKHKLLGFVNCPSSFDIVHSNNIREIPLYQLLEDVPADEVSFDGKTGDLLFGGGSGEAPAMRISTDKCFRFFILKENVDLVSQDELFKAYWTPTQSFKYGDGFIKSGWTPDKSLEHWLVENICLVLSKEPGFERYKNRSASGAPLKWTTANL